MKILSSHNVDLTKYGLKGSAYYIRVNYIRYGTNDNKEIMMLRYGFDFEDFEWLSPIVKCISEEEIVFADVTALSEEQSRKIERYL